MTKIPRVGTHVSIRLPNDGPITKGPLAHLVPPWVEIQGIIEPIPEWETNPDIFCLLVPGSDVPVRHINKTRVLAINGVEAKFEKTPGKEVFKVEGSNGNSYMVVREGNNWRCTCPGFVHRGACKHVSKLRDE